MLCTQWGMFNFASNKESDREWESEETNKIEKMSAIFFVCVLCVCTGNHIYVCIGIYTYVDTYIRRKALDSYNNNNNNTKKRCSLMCSKTNPWKAYDISYISFFISTTASAKSCAPMKYIYTHAHNTIEVVVYASQWKVTRCFVVAIVKYFSLSCKHTYTYLWLYIPMPLANIMLSV